jgi:hypothetical protein
VSKFLKRDVSVPLASNKRNTHGRTAVDALEATAMSGGLRDELKYAAAERLDD